MLFQVVINISDSGIENTLFEKFVKGNTELAIYSRDFMASGQTQQAIESSGRCAMAVIFDGKDSDSLSSLRHSILKKKVMSIIMFVNSERLLPTASACKFNSFRVYFQMMIWMRSEEGLDPKN